MKVLKKIGKVLLWIAIAVVALLLTLPLWIGALVKPVANSIVSSKTGTTFNLGEFGLNQYNGRLTVGDMQLYNPDGFDQKMAVTLGKLFVDVDMGSVMSDTIVLEDVLVKDVFVSYVSNKQGEYNFDVIQRNATGGKVEKKDEKPAEAKKPAEDKPAEADKPAKKIIIDHLKIENVLVQLGPIPVPFSIELNGIGRKSSGVTAAEAWEEIRAQIMSSLGALGDSVNTFIDAAHGFGKEQAGKVVKGMGDAFKGGTDIVNGATSKTVDAVSKSTGKAVGAVSESTGKAVDAIKGLFK